MERLIAAELRKLFTTRLWLWLLLASGGLTALFVSLTIGFSGAAAANPAAVLSTGTAQRSLFSSASIAGSLMAVLGAIGITSEYRHMTVTPTFLASPKRGRVVTAKLISFGLVGLGYALVCIATEIGIALPWLAVEGVAVSLGANGIPAVLGGVLASVAIYTLVGVGLGALVRNQVGTVVRLLVYFFVVEQILVSIPALQAGTKFLPRAAGAALTQTTPMRGFDTLHPWQGGLVLAGYGIVLAVLGTFLAVRRDVT